MQTGVRDGVFSLNGPVFELLQMEKLWMDNWRLLLICQWVQILGCRAGDLCTTFACGWAFLWTPVEQLISQAIGFVHLEAECRAYKMAHDAMI